MPSRMTFIRRLSINNVIRVSGEMRDFVSIFYFICRHTCLGKRLFNDIDDCNNLSVMREPYAHGLATHD